MKRDIQCAATSFLHAEKGRKETPGALPLVPQVIGRFSPHENRRWRGRLNLRHTERGPGAPGSLGGIIL